jgi:hypothetical protein
MVVIIARVKERGIYIIRIFRLPVQSMGGTLVSTWVVEQVILVIIFAVIPLAQRCDLSHDGLALDAE